MQNKFRIYFISFIFLMLIAFPGLNAEFKFVNDIENLENRQMTSKPVMNFTYLDPYPAKFEKYFNDNFPLRSLMIKYYNLLNIEVFKKSPVPNKVVIGKDHWLYMAGEELNCYMGVAPLDQSELEAFKEELEYRKAYLEERNCKFYFMVAPIKACIYPEYLPNSVYRIGKQSRGEQLVDYLTENCEVKPINVYDVLRSRKDEELVYFKLDNHWNQLGAFYSALEFFKHVQPDFPEVEVPVIEDYIVSKKEIRTGNIFSMLSKIGDNHDYSFNIEPKAGFQAKDVKLTGYPVVKGFPYPHEYEMDKEIAGSDNPKILIICDSYGGNIFPFLAEGFSRSVKIFDCWQYKLNEDIVNNEKPDIVLMIVLEVNLRAMLIFQSRLNP